MKRSQLVLLSIASLAMSWAAHATQDGPEPLKVIYLHDAVSANTVMQIAIAGGQNSEGDQAGIAYLTARLALEIAEQNQLTRLMECGASYYATVLPDYTLINIKSPSAEFSRTVSTLGKVMQEPLFSAIRIDWVKQSMAAFQAQAAEDPAALTRCAERRMFGWSPDQHASVFGTPMTLKAIGKKNINDYYRRHYCKNNMCVVVCSDLAEKAVRAMIVEALGAFPAGQALTPLTATPAPSVERECHIAKDTLQTSLAWSYPLSAATAEQYVSAKLLETLLGKGIDCRLWQLRANYQLIYSFQTVYTPGKLGSSLRIALKVSADRVPEARAAVGAIISELTANGITSAEWESTKLYAQTVWWQARQDKEDICATIAMFTALGFGEQLFTELPARFNAAPLAAFNDFLKQTLTPASRIEITVGK